MRHPFAKVLSIVNLNEKGGLEPGKIFDEKGGVNRVPRSDQILTRLSTPSSTTLLEKTVCLPKTVAYAGHMETRDPGQKG